MCFLYYYFIVAVIDSIKGLYDLFKFLFKNIFKRRKNSLIRRESI
jgi:hypothetical protein